MWLWAGLRVKCCEDRATPVGTSLGPSQLTHPRAAPSSLHGRAGGAGPGCGAGVIPTVVGG